MVFRSTPTCRAIALTDRPWRCRSRIMTRSPSLITRSSLPPAGGASGIRCSRRSSRASPGRSAVTKTGEISNDTSGENTGATYSKGPPGLELGVPIDARGDDRRGFKDAKARGELSTGPNMRLAASHVEELIQGNGDNRFVQDGFAAVFMPDERDDGRQFRYRNGVNPGRRFQLEAADLNVALEGLFGLVAANGVAGGAVLARTEIVAVEHACIGVKAAAGRKVRAAAAAKRRRIERGVVAKPRGRLEVARGFLRGATGHFSLISAVAPRIPTRSTTAGAMPSRASTAARTEGSTLVIIATCRRPSNTTSFDPFD